MFQESEKLLKKEKKSFGWRKFFMAMGVLVFVLVILSVVAATLIEQRIKKQVIEEVNESLTVPVRVNGGISLSLFSHFPNAAMSFGKVSIDDPLDNGKKKLIEVDEVSFLCNIYSLFTSKVEFSKILIRKGKLNLHVAANGKANYDIFSPKSNGNEELAIQLQKVIVQDIYLTYKDDKTSNRSEAAVKKIELKGNFEDKEYTLEVIGKFGLKYISNSRETFMAERDVTIEFLLDVDKLHNKYFFKDSKIGISESMFSLTGTLTDYKESQQVDFVLTNEGEDVRNLIALLPNQYKDALSSAEGSGAYSIKASVKGRIADAEAPAIKFSATLKDSEIKLGKYNKLLRNVNASATYNIDEKGNDRLDISNFNCTLNNLPFNFRLTLINLSNPSFDFYSNGVLHLSEIKPFIPDSILKDPEGTIHFNDFRLKGRKSDFETTENSTLVGSGNFQLQEIEFNHNGVTYGNINGLLSYNSQAIEAENLTLNFLGTDFAFTGRIDQLMPFVYNLSAHRSSNDVTLGVNGRMKIKVFDLANIISTYDKKGAAKPATKVEIKDVLNMKGNLQLEIGELLYKNMKFSDVNTIVQLSPGAIKLNRLETNAMNGALRASGLISFDERNDLAVSLEISAVEMSVSEIFKQCDNFGQKTLTDKNLKGKISVGLTTNLLWKNAKEFDEKSMSAIVDFSITNGELIKFEPLKAASKFIRIEELEDIKFSDLSNTIKIGKGRIDIPEFEIKSSALNVMFFGYHYFTNDVDYHFKINLHKLLANKFRRNRRDDVQYIENDPYEGTNIYLSMTGNLANPVIRYDKTSAKSKMQADFKNEKQVLKDLIQNKSVKKDDVEESKYFDVREEPQFMDFDTLE